MLWVLRLTLCATLAVATAAEAHGGSADDITAVSSALTRTGGIVGKAGVGPERAVTSLILPTGLKALAQPLLQGVVGADRRGLIGRWNTPRVPGDGSALETFGDSGEWASGNGGIRYAVSSRVSLGLNYRRVTEEDLRFEVAETGSLESDYDSHSFVVQARWEF